MPYDDLSMLQRFRNAVESLATGTGSLQQRLTDAYAIQLHCLRREDFPESLQEIFASIDLYLTRKDAKGDEGTIAATTMSLPDDHAIRIAKAIVDLSYRLEAWPDE